MLRVAYRRRSKVPESRFMELWALALDGNLLLWRDPIRVTVGGPIAFQSDVSEARRLLCEPREWSSLEEARNAIRQFLTTTGWYIP